jgi:hypothetical protein
LSCRHRNGAGGPCEKPGADHAAFAHDKLVRGVQAVRDSSSGAAFELSDQYDHAWLNGNNECIVSDDPSFNPNGNLNGNWKALQAQR